MSITVFGASYSTRTQRVLLVLEELGRDYELKNVDLMKGEHYVRNFHGLHFFMSDVLLRLLALSSHAIHWPRYLRLK